MPNTYIKIQHPSLFKGQRLNNLSDAQIEKTPSSYALEGV